MHRVVSVHHLHPRVVEASLRTLVVGSVVHVPVVAMPHHLVGLVARRSTWSEPSISTHLIVEASTSLLPIVLVELESRL